jgi:predicted transcriptional regulator
MDSNEERVFVNTEASAAIQRGIRAADEGRVVSSDEARKLVARWIYEFPTRPLR